MTVSPFITTNRIDNEYIIPEDVIQHLFNNIIREDIKNIIDKVLYIVKTCDICCAILNDEHETVLDYMYKVIVIIQYFLNKLCHISNITINIRNNISKYIKFNCVMNCEQKHIEQYVINKYILIHIRENIKIINNIVKGVENPTIQTGELQVLAHKYYEKHC